MPVRACADVLLFLVNDVFPEQSGCAWLLKGKLALESSHADYLEVFFFFFLCYFGIPIVFFPVTGCLWVC